MTDRPRPLALAAWRSFLTAHARVTEVLDAEMRAAHGLALTWYDVLLQLNEAGGRLRMSELAEAVLLSRSNCTRLVDRMDTAGLVAREADARDARSRWAVLTPEGKQRLREAAPTHLAGIERYFTSRLDDDAATSIAERLNAVVDSLPVRKASAAPSSTGATRRRAT